MRELIPIFPLSLVMFPGAVYPIHIFEERYKKLINYCTKTSEGFGVIAKIDEDHSNIGCYVKVIEIINTYDNGSMDIIVKGIKRFKIKSMDNHPDGYVTAKVEDFFDNLSEYIDPDEEQIVVEKFKEILIKTNIELSSKFWEKLDSASNKSFKIAEKSGLNLRQQQDLLDLQSERERINMLKEHFIFLENFLNQNEMHREIIMNDGYLN